MAIVDLVMPRMGEGIIEATLLKWHKQPGDHVDADETVLEVATDKVDSEVPATAAGTIKELLYKENDVVPVDAVIARIETEGKGESPAPLKEAVSTPVTDIPVSAPAVNGTPVVQKNPVQTGTPANRFYSPLVMNIAAKEGIPFSELEKIPGTGTEGRVTKNDLLAYLKQRNTPPAAPQPAAAQAVPADTGKPATNAAPEAASAATPDLAKKYGNNVSIIAMDRMRKIIADHMVKSKATSPHVTSFTEADVTNLVNWREKNKKEFERKYGEKITFMPIFIEAVSNCLRDFPLVNASLDGDNIIVKKDINIGMATALPDGNLIVPVIKNADTKNLLGLAKDVNQLAKTARAGKLKPDDTQGGTFTISNLGTFNNLMGTPIINQPQVAIIAVGAIKKRPVVLETPSGDVIAIRHMMYLSMSYDHRLVDGSLGASFLAAVTRELEDFDGTREI